MGRERSLEPTARHTPGTDTSAPARTADGSWCPRLKAGMQSGPGRQVLGKCLTFLSLSFLTCQMGSMASPADTVRGQIIHTTAGGHSTQHSVGAP